MGKNRSSFGTKKDSGRGQVVQSQKTWGRKGPSSWSVFDGGEEHFFDKMWDAIGFYWDRSDMKSV